MKTYQTIQGDTWDLIAFKQYGTSMVMNQLMEANPSLLDIAVFSANVTVNLPEIDTVIRSDNKPPWAR